MKKLLIVAVLALLLTALVGGTVATGSGGANSAGADAKDTFVYQMTPGQHVSDYGDLGGTISQQVFDVYFIINTSTSAGNLKVVIEDCCIMGDTMLGILIRPGVSPVVKWATSPSVVTLGPVSMPGRNWALVIAGYLQCPGGFPAGYYWDIWM